MRSDLAAALSGWAAQVTGFMSDSLLGFFIARGNSFSENANQSTIESRHFRERGTTARKHGIFTSVAQIQSRDFDWRCNRGFEILENTKSKHEIETQNQNTKSKHRKH